MLPQLLEAELQSVVQQQAQGSADQANAIRRALDSKCKELSEMQALLADLGRQHDKLQAEYDFRYH
jgi:hypothetical protein